MKHNKIINIEDELKKSYLDYAMSVIISRALPDARDGLKPVHRRILYAMNILNNNFNKNYKKSARIVGDVIGKYHPHGDNSVYDSIVRMAQNFSLRYPLIDGQGNFGSIDGDSAAAMRYTEIRMSKISSELLKDIEKNTVNFNLNYDNTEKIPEILPSRIPNLLINGSYGIAVGVSTNIPPHNIEEVINACLVLIKNENVSVKELMKYILGPDFPTGATIHGIKDIENIYKTGKGKICIKSKTVIEKDNLNNKYIIIKEIPYQTSKTKIIEKILELIKNKKIYGINDIRDESNQKGIRIVISVKKDSSTKIILNNLYINTPLQTNLYINMIALYNKKPILMNLKDILNIFIEHRKKIIYRRTLYLLEKYNKNINILEGFIVTISNIEKIINIIKNSLSIENAKNELEKNFFSINKNLINILSKKKYYKNINYNINEKKYFLNKEQIKSILELKLHKLTNLEYNNLYKDYNLLIKEISKNESIINNEENLKKVIYDELIEIKNTYKDIRLTNIIKEDLLINKNLLINNFKILITLSYNGYIKYQALSNYDIQKRGGTGKYSSKIQSEDFISCLIVSNTHDEILLFSNNGKMYKIKAYQIPELNKSSKGKLINSIINMEKNERITTLLSVNFNNINKNNYIIMITKNGYIKKTSIINLIKNRNSGFIVIKLNNNDELVESNITNGSNDIIIFTEKGKSLRFNENKIRPTNRNSLGIKAINMENDKIISLIICDVKNKYILSITKNGFGKRTEKIEFPIKSRATKGIISTKINNKSGNLIKSIEINNNDHILIITDNGKLMRINSSDIRISKRNTFGVKLIKVYKNECVVDLKKIINDIML